VFARVEVPLSDLFTPVSIYIPNRIAASPIGSIYSTAA
jgi:hypothetical protein